MEKAMDDKWKLRFVELAKHTAGWSKQKVKVGAVVTNPQRRVCGVGYNGPPEDFNDADLTEENSTFVVIHAEINALENSTGSNLTLFVTSQPCLPCAAAIVASHRVVEVVFPSVGSTGRWSESQKQAIKHFEKKGIRVTYHG